MDSDEGSNKILFNIDDSVRFSHSTEIRSVGGAEVVLRSVLSREEKLVVYRLGKVSEELWIRTDSRVGIRAKGVLVVVPPRSLHVLWIRDAVSVHVSEVLHDFLNNLRV